MVSRGNRYAAETARLLLEHKADVNSRCAPSGNFRWKSIASCTYAPRTQNTVNESLTIMRYGFAGRSDYFKNNHTT